MKSKSTKTCHCNFSKSGHKVKISKVKIPHKKASAVGLGMMTAAAGVAGVGTAASMAGAAGVGMTASMAGAAGLGMTASMAGMAGAGTAASMAGVAALLHSGKLHKFCKRKSKCR